MKNKSIKDRLASSFDVQGECWVWNKCRNNNGYGQIGINGKTKLAHRVSYEEYVGQIPEGLGLDHLCRVRACIRPDHMEPVTQQENCKRGLGGKYPRNITHCPRGHVYDEANTRSYKNLRNCRACNRAACKQYREKKRNEDKKEEQDKNFRASL